jgi:hypothetical protein
MNLFPPEYENHQRAAPDEPARFAELRTGKMAEPTPPPVSLGVKVLTYACAAAIVLAIIALIDLAARH